MLNADAARTFLRTFRRWRKVEESKSTSETVLLFLWGKFSEFRENWRQISLRVESFVSRFSQSNLLLFQEPCSHIWFWNSDEKKIVFLSSSNPTSFSGMLIPLLCGVQSRWDFFFFFCLRMQTSTFNSTKFHWLWLSDNQTKI